MTKARVNADNASADIQGVTAGTGLSGGGTSGTVSLAVDTTTIQARVANVTDTEIGYLDGVTSAIQTQLNGKINNTLTTTTGDIIYASSANTPARLGIGSSGQILSVSSGIPAWTAAPASGGMTLISQQSMSGSSTIQWTSIPTTYKHLLVTVNGYNTNGQLYTRLNNISSSNYYNNTFGFTTEFYASGPLNGSANSNYCNAFFWVFNYPATGGFKLCQGFGYMRNNSGSDTAREIYGFLDQTTGAISSVQLVSSSGNFTAGTANLWGVS
jgi:hypothetical protein